MRNRPGRRLRHPQLHPVMPGQRSHRRVLAAVEGPLVFADHDRVPAPARISERGDQSSGLRAARPRQHPALPNVEELGHDLPVPGHQRPGLAELPRQRRHRILVILGGHPPVEREPQPTATRPRLTLAAGALRPRRQLIPTCTRTATESPMARCGHSIDLLPSGRYKIRSYSIIHNIIGMNNPYPVITRHFTGLSPPQRPRPQPRTTHHARHRRRTRPRSGHTQLPRRRFPEPPPAADRSECSSLIGDWGGAPGTRPCPEQVPAGGRIGRGVPPPGAPPAVTWPGSGGTWTPPSTWSRGNWPRDITSSPARSCSATASYWNSARPTLPAW